MPAPRDRDSARAGSKAGFGQSGTVKEPLAETAGAEAGGDNGSEERIRCQDVIIKYRKIPCTLTGGKLQRAVKKLQRERIRKRGFFHKLFRIKDSPSKKPVPAREIWSSGLSFLSREKIRTRQALLLYICFSAHSRLHTKIHAQAYVDGCGEGKGRYPWKVEVTFTDLDRKAFEVLRDPRRYMPKG